MEKETHKKGHNFKREYVYDNHVHSQVAINSDERLKQVFSNFDKAKYMYFRLLLAATIGDNGYAKIETHPDNVFKAYDANNKLIQISDK